MPCRTHSVSDTRALLLGLRAAVTTSPSWRQREACDVHHSRMAFDHQCQPWREKETVVVYDRSTYTRSNMARLKPGEVGAQKTALQVRIWSKAELREATWSCGWARRQEDIWVLCVGLKEQANLSLQSLT